MLHAARRIRAKKDGQDEEQRADNLGEKSLCGMWVDKCQAPESCEATSDGLDQVGLTASGDGDRGHVVRPDLERLCVFFGGGCGDGQTVSASKGKASTSMIRFGW